MNPKHFKNFKKDRIIKMATKPTTKVTKKVTGKLNSFRRLAVTLVLLLYKKNMAYSLDYARILLISKMTKYCKFDCLL